MKLLKTELPKGFEQEFPTIAVTANLIVLLEKRIKELEKEKKHLQNELDKLTE